MGKPAARAGDMHSCPMFDGPKPHVGGPVMPPGTPTVLIGGLPAATVGNMCTCVGPPDSIILGSTGVLIGGKPAARMGDSTAHGGVIVLGCPTVLIGEVAGGGGGAAGAAAMSPVVLNKMTAETAKNELNKQALGNAAQAGDGMAPRTEKEDLKSQFSLVDEAQKAVAGTEYEIETSDGKKHKGKTDGSGKTQNLSGYLPADCRLTFFNQ